MKEIRFYLILTLALFQISCTSINITNNTGEDLSKVYVIYTEVEGTSGHKLDKPLSRNKNTTIYKMLAKDNQFYVVGFDSKDNIYRSNRVLKKNRHNKIELINGTKTASKSQ